VTASKINVGGGVKVTDDDFGTDELNPLTNSLRQRNETARFLDDGPKMDSDNESDGISRQQFLPFPSWGATPSSAHLYFRCKQTFNYNVDSRCQWRDIQLAESSIKLGKENSLQV
jgi:hypothetical protein